MKTPFSFASGISHLVNKTGEDMFEMDVERGLLMDLPEAIDVSLVIDLSLVISP